MSITYILKSNFILRTRAKLLILHDDNFTRYIYKLRKAKLRICTCTGAIFEQGSEEVQSAFKFAILTYNKNVSGRRFELQAFVDIINTADAFKLSRLSKFFILYYFFSFVTHTLRSQHFIKLFLIFFTLK